MKMLPYTVEARRPYITAMCINALDGLDGSCFQMNKRQKAKVKRVLTVKMPGGTGPNCSRANGEGITINLSYWQVKNVMEGKNGREIDPKKVPDGHAYWAEYAAFDANEECGGMWVKTGDANHANLIQVLHEVSHFVQFSLWKSNPTRWAYMRKSHGEGFVQIYKKLRKAFCNDPDDRAAFIERCQT